MYSCFFSYSSLLFVRWRSQLYESDAALFFLPFSTRRHLNWAALEYYSTQVKTDLKKYWVLLNHVQYQSVLHPAPQKYWTILKHEYWTILNFVQYNSARVYIYTLTYTESIPVMLVISLSASRVSSSIDTAKKQQGSSAGGGGGQQGDV
jgi:hypothetical protein